MTLIPDLGEAVVKMVVSNLDKINGFSSNQNGKIKCYVTDDPSLFNNVAGRFCLKKIEQAIQIDL